MSNVVTIAILLQTTKVLACYGKNTQLELLFSFFNLLHLLHSTWIFNHCFYKSTNLRKPTDEKEVGTRKKLLFTTAPKWTWKEVCTNITLFINSLTVQRSALEFREENDKLKVRVMELTTTLQNSELLNTQFKQELKLSKEGLFSRLEKSF